MKFFVVVILFAALVAAVLGGLAPTPPSHCDYECTKLDLPTCAYNGRCYLQMRGPCALQKYNCLNPLKAFHQVDQYKCKEDSAPQCQLGDY